MSALTFNENLEKQLLLTSFQGLATKMLVDWRNGPNHRSAEAWGRRFVIIIPMALLGLVGLIDSVASLLLSLLFLPAELIGVQLSRCFFQRSIISIVVTLLDLTVYQYLNLKENVLRIGDVGSSAQFIVFTKS